MKKEVCSSNDKIASGFVKVMLYPRLYNYFSYMCYVPGMISQQDVSIWLLLEINFWIQKINHGHLLISQLQFLLKVLYQQ